MISSATFHVITTELVVGSFAMAGICFLVLAIQSFGLFESEKASLVTDYAGHFALGFGLLATPLPSFLVYLHHRHQIYHLHYWLTRCFFQ